MRYRVTPLSIGAIIAIAFLFASKASAFIDLDGDGYDDVWQRLYNVTVAEFPLNGDYDGDGVSNYAEMLAGTNPRDPTDAFKVGNMFIAGSSVVISTATQAGKSYLLQSSASPGGPTWTNEGSAFVGDGNPHQFVTAMGSGVAQKFYHVQVSDIDSDGDGIPDWAEIKMGTDPHNATSATNASGGTANDYDTLRSLMSITASVVTPDAFAKDGTPAVVRLTRSFGTMALKVPFNGGAGATDPTKSSATSADYTVAGAVNGTVSFPAGATTLDVNVNGVTPAAPKVPRALKMSFSLPNLGAAPQDPSAVVNIKDAQPVTANQQLYVAYLGKEAGVNTTATGIATALVSGDNDSAQINLTFSDLTSGENPAYIQIGSGLPVLPIGTGQISGKQWNIRAAQFVLTDQAMLDALAAGQLFVRVSTANNPSGEILGYFNKASGSTSFDPNDPATIARLAAPPYTPPTGSDLDRNIYRFLIQCTYGPTTALYNEVKAAVTAATNSGGTVIDGYRNWLNTQLDSAQTPSVDFTTLVMAADNEEFVMRGNKPITAFNDPQFYDNISYTVTYDSAGHPIVGTTNNNNYANNYPSSSANRRREWWTMVLQCKDQVRQRMAMALSEIMVTSEADGTLVNYPYGMAKYWDMLAQNAFGNYRTVLEKVTYSPIMGIYLSHMNNRAAYVSGGVPVSPDENYAREVMQLFSIGLVMRQPDGSLVLGTDGLPIATYDQTDITEMARVLTGFAQGARHQTATSTNYNGATLTTSSQRTSPDIEFNTVNYSNFNRDDGLTFFEAPWIYPMCMVGKFGTTIYHDFGQKTLLHTYNGGTTVAAQTVNTGDADSSTHPKAAADVTQALNLLAGDPTQSSYVGHQNTPVNISRWLIQRFVTSNPSAGYVYRVAQTYIQKNGNLGEVLKAILLDNEARSLTIADSSISAGRVKEPIIAYAATLRALKAFSGAPVSNLSNSAMTFAANESMMSNAYPASEVAKFTDFAPPSLPTGWTSGPTRFRFGDTTASFGQSPQHAPSVFNWFLPDYTVPGTMASAGLVAPELQLGTAANEVAKVNFHWTYTNSNIVGMATPPGTNSNVSDFTLN